VRVLFLNQFFPPDPAPTGLLLAEVAEELQRGGDSVDLVAARQDYRGGQKQRGRMRRELSALARMLADGLRRPRADVVVSGSSPPCLLVVATLLAWRHRAKSVHWAMDVYPEIAEALGEVRDGVFARVLRTLMGWCYRRAALVVALDKDMAERLRLHGVNARLARPWVTGSRTQLTADGEVSPRRSSQAAPQPADSREPWTWLYSGNLGRAHEWETLLQAQALLEARGVPARLIFQGGGPSWENAQSRAQELQLRRCEWRDYAPKTELRESLLSAECCVVTQRPETRGLLWPSKLAVLLTLPRRILFVGPEEGAIATSLRSLRHAAVFAPGDAAEVAEWIEREMATPTAVAGSEIVDATAHRAASLGHWSGWMRELL